MSRSCPACRAEGPDEARFCSACGGPLGEVLPRRRERKLATILFADVVGSTELAEREDPEVVEAAVGRAFEAAALEIERHGGLIEKYIGDAILAVFGVPAVHEDDSERAVRAALAIQTSMEERGRSTASSGRPALAMRIGIDAGEVLVDVERAAGPRQRMITGDAVNTAARLEQAAAPGRVVVGATVHEATIGTIEYRPLAPLVLKGKAGPVAAWEAVRPIAAPEGRRAPLRLEAELVGRAEELAWLTDALDQVRAEGRPRLVCVLGPAGIGKSRLAHEFTRLVERRTEPVVVRHGRCASFGDVSYSAIAETLRVECGVLDDDAPETVRSKVAATMVRLLGSPDVAPHVEALIGTYRGPPFARHVLFDAWRRVLEQLASAAPLVLVLEDLHWADDGLLDFVDHVAAWAGAPILVVAVARPEILDRRPAWRAEGVQQRTLSLEPLSRGETEAMLRSLLSARLPPGLATAIFDAGEGNPLFLEEITRMLVDRGVVRPGDEHPPEPERPVGRLEVPRTIQALLSARLDSLPAEEKGVLQDASVLGRTFWVGALGDLSGEPEERTLAILDRLRAKGFVTPGTSPAAFGLPEYVFRHVLIRDVAYDSLPKAIRADKHVTVARWAEHQAGHRSEEIAEVLATHQLEALRWLDELGVVGGDRDAVERDGYRWARCAGERSRRLWQGREAARWLRAALELGSRIGRPEEDMAALWESFASASDGVLPHEEVVRAWEEALARYARLGRTRDIGRVEASIAWSSIWAGQASEAQRRAERAVERLEPLEESADLGFALFVLGRHLLEHQDLDRAEPLLRRAIAVAGRVGDRPTEANAMIALGWTLHGRRRGGETIELFDGALRTARRAGDPSLLLDALEAELSAAVEVTGEYARAERLCREAIEVAGRAGNLSKLGRARLNLAYLLREVGRLDEVAEPARAGREAGIAVGDPTVVAWTHAVEALTAGVRGSPETAGASLDAFRSVIGRVDFGAIPYVEEFGGLIEGYIAIGRGRRDEAAARLSEAVESVSDERLSVWGGQLLLFECIRAQLDVGRRDEAMAARSRLDWLGVANVPPRAFLAWGDGLLADEPREARRHLLEAIVCLGSLGRRMDLGRCLLDLGAVEAGLGCDGRLAVECGRALLRSCGAELFLRSATVGET